MDSNFFNRSLVLVGVMIIFFGLAGYFLNWKHQATTEVQADYNYEMIRPEDEGGKFDLSDRDIDRRILKNNENLSVGADAVAKADPKKNTKPADKKTAAKTKTTSTLDKSKMAKPAVSVRVVDGPTSTGLSPSQKDKNNSQAQNPEQNTLVGTLNTAPTTSEERTPENEEDEAKELRLTADEWRRLLNDHLDAALASRISRAHDQGYLTDADFYQLLFEQMQSNRQQARAWVLGILNRDNSLRSFEFMATEYGKLPEDARSDLWKVLSSYRQANKFLPLAQALHVKDKNVVNLAMQVVTLAVQDQKKRIELASNQQSTPASAGGVGSLSRNVAGQVNGQAYNIFLSGLTKWAQSNDSGLTPVAQGLVSEIQKFVKT